MNTDHTYNRPHSASRLICRGNYQHILAALFLCFFFFTGNAQPAYIDPNKPVNPLAKPGYNLIFVDDFDTFNSATWDRSYPGNDGPNVGDDDFCTHTNVRKAPKDPANVLDPTIVDDVVCLPLRIKKAENENICGYSSAEIKSFLNEIESPNYKDWKIYENTYVEVRLKAPDCTGVGAAAWLYGPSQTNYDEIDFVELYGDAPSSFQTAMHWGPHDNRKSDDNNSKVDLFDLESRPVNLSDYFLTYGVYLDPNGPVRITVNDSYVSSKKLYENLNGKTDPFKRLQPYNLRIGTGSTTLSGGTVDDCNNLPVYLYVDYVRVYQKAGTKAVKYHPNTTGKMNLCSSGGGKNFGITYYPGAVYTWSVPPGLNVNNPDEEVEHQGDDNWRYYWVSVVPGVAAGVYQLTLTITFPDGYAETLPLEVTVNNGAAPTPGVIQIATSPSEASAFVMKQAGTMGYEWRISNGAWKYVDNSIDPGTWNVCPGPLIPKPGQNSLNVCVRSVTACATSGSVCKTISFPVENGMNSPRRPSTPGDVEAELVSDCEYRLKVAQSEYASEYLWSYDTEEWFPVSAEFGSAYNRFGNYVCGSGPFDIFVRAKSDNFITDIYTEQITIPEGNANRSDGGDDGVIRYEHEDMAIESVVVTNVFGQNLRMSDRIAEPDHVILDGLQSGVYIFQYLGRDGALVKARKVAFVANH